MLQNQTNYSFPGKKPQHKLEQLSRHHKLQDSLAVLYLFLGFPALCFPLALQMADRQENPSAQNHIHFEIAHVWSTGTGKQHKAPTLCTVPYPTSILYICFEMIVQNIEMQVPQKFHYKGGL